MFGLRAVMADTCMVFSKECRQARKLKAPSLETLVCNEVTTED